MIHVARDERKNFNIPLMIGFLQLLKYIQAVKLMDNYTNNLVFHVLDETKA